MVLKATGGRLYYPASVGNVDATVRQIGLDRRVGSLQFMFGRADVVEVVIGRIPIANLADYSRRREQPDIEPFLNPTTGNFRGLVYRLETDALTVAVAGAEGDELTLHSLKHALLNAAPAVTGLTQEEFGAEVQVEEGRLIIYDKVQGGSGGCQLLADRRLERWLAVARELAECHQIQCDDACRGCLFLPSRICRRFNQQLDRKLLLQLIP